MFQQMPPHQQMHPHNQPPVNAPPQMYRENRHDYSTYNSFQPPTPNMPRQHDPQEQAVLASLQYPAWERYENGQAYNCAEHINGDPNNGQYMPQHYYGPSHGPLLGPDEMPCPGPGQLPQGPHQAGGMGGPNNNMMHSGHRSHTQQPYHSQHHYHHQQGRGPMPPHMWQPSYHNTRPQAGHPYRKGQQHQWQRLPHGQHHQYGRHHYGGQQQRGNKHGGRAANRKAFQFDGTTPAFVPQFQSNRQLELQILSQASADANSNSPNTRVNNDSPERRPALDVVARRRQHRKVSSEAQGRRRPGLLPAQRHAAQPTEESSRRNRHLGGCWHSALPCGG
ncbi:hypothetical protein, conserved [Eimeria necatrix]|uniref:Uncharacterized protein n=1 Tax=Eimeria necatrix TaxID=51315 RepID=U6MGH8_9EIME|nr:hypothetical protein, conserved [Eimeria necatrix]CDJ63362.1 hypothetical protein, conserved [Eimeria necatrix]